MAFTPTPQQNTAAQSNGQIILKDWRHAANLFNVDQFRLAPKTSFLFHVAFGINTKALTNSKLVSTYGQEINMLVKSIDLPSFTINTEVLNQYNRKKVVQNQVKYTEISVKFHDDNMGLINQVWQEYFSYYYADSTTATVLGAYARNATKSYSTIPASYGYDAGSTDPFFNYIKIYQMARHEFVCYQLYNPIISSWSHNKLDYAQSSPHDFDMKILYESVSYSVGSVTADNPEGFGVTHYDTTPSSLTGTIPTGAATASFVPTINTAGLTAGVLSNAVSQVNTYQNSQTNGGGLGSLVSTAAAIAGVAAIAGGLSGISFPSLSGSTSATSASGGDSIATPATDSSSTAATDVPASTDSSVSTQDEGSGYGTTPTQSSPTDGSINYDQADF